MLFEVKKILIKSADLYMKNRNMRTGKVSTQKKSIRILASLGLLLAAIIWGFAFVVVKNSLDYIPPTYMLAFRFTIASVVLGLIFLKKLMYLSKKIVREGAIVGFFLFISYFFQTVGIQYTTAGKNAFLTTIYVIIVPFLYWIFKKKRPDMYCMGAAVLAIAGIGLLSLQSDLSINIGDVLTLICGVGYSFHIICIDRYTDDCDPVVLTILQLGFAALFSWILAPFMDGGFPAQAFEPSAVMGMLYLGLLSTMLAFLLQNLCQKYTSPDTASVLLSFESVFGALFSVIFLHEILSPKMLVGCVLLFIAVIMSETKFAFLPWKKKRN